MLLGSRVVRGPDWKTRKNSDSIEVGFVGTIINLHHFQDGRPLPKETVLVHWDTGEQTCCRAGQDGYYDLRIFDSAPAGVKFKGFLCGGCQEADIAGMRWQCAVCPNYVYLCTSCYMNDMHDREHRFMRFDTPSDKYNGIEVGERSTSFKIPPRGIFPGAKVRTKKDMKFSWTSPVLIGGQVLDIMTWDDIPRSTVLVKWGEIGEQTLRLGYEGEVDLELIEFAYGPYFYPNHLPMVSVGAHLRFISKIVSCEKISNKEITEEGENAINYLNELLSECDHESKAMLCRIKREIQERQHAIDKSENTQKLVSLSSKQEKDSQASPTSDVALETDVVEARSTSDVAMETTSFQNANHFSAGTDEIDSCSINKSRAAHLVSKFSPDNGQKEDPLPGNERNECEVSEVLHNVSWIKRKFEKMTSYNMRNLYNYDKTPMQRAPYASNKVYTVPYHGQDKKQDSSDDTVEGIKTPSTEKGKKEKACSKPYLSTSGDKKSIQLAPYVAKEQDTFDVITTPSVAERVKRMNSKFEATDEGICADAASPINLAASCKIPNVISEKKSMHYASYVTSEIPTVTVPSQAEKQGTFDVITTPSVAERVKRMKSKFEAKDENICADTASPINLAASFRKPSLPNQKPMQRGPYATNEVPNVSSRDKKQGTIDVTTTLRKEIPKKENSEFEAKGEDTCADTKYVSRLVRRFEADLDQ